MKILTNLNKAKNLTHINYRPDIDGLRAIAILSVVTFHAFPSFLKGGFIGVDIFFVISGYLISNIIFENVENNSFSFKEFYKRRIKRIFPALFLVLITCFVFGYFTLLSDEYRQLTKHIAAGVGFVSNFVFWSESGYFDNIAETKPLLHLWSLGIEEQFYVFWPLLIWTTWKKEINLLVITTILAILSFIWNIIDVHSDIIATFYSPQTRFWELLMGSLLSYIALTKSSHCVTNQNKSHIFINNIINKTPVALNENNLQNVKSFMGVLIIGVGLLLINKDSFFPGFLALFPTIGSVLIISAGSQAWFNRVILSSPVMIWFGLISYPLYLWHWPLLSFARILESNTLSINIRLAAVLISVLFAWLTFILVELPLRLSKNSSVVSTILVMLISGLGLVAFDAYENERKPDGAAKMDSLTRQIGWTLPVASEKQMELCNKLFPERALIIQNGSDNNNVFCFLAKDAAPNVLLVGDSMNLSLFPGISKDENINVAVLASSSAAPLYNVRSTNKGVDTLRSFNYKITNYAIDYALKNDNVKVVVMSFLSGPALTAPHGIDFINIEKPNDNDVHHVFTEALTFTLTSLLKHNKKVIFVLPNPALGFDIKSCISSYRPIRLTDKAVNTCSGINANNLGGSTHEYRDWVKTVLVNFPQVKLFDASEPFCSVDNCWAMKDGKILYRDSGHLSLDGSDFVAPILLNLIHNELER